ncbi:preprotein translocase subunit SecE [Mycobacterium shinjukuense]|uniref:Protein translocase subunit SecE n=1 Tax=Mycobacterium shinjukuense TaxID=398694 RepID=A0A7I7MSX4_9MYCO|nr:preprotein translocase subunit SecE [Mycobacterium shinjukuense]MCV6987247.1 preprotein translocase subunit SecE [Mycobacterium shinjukuense]ORB64472.1 preprotein translocase subunit SecE [Mycobacterium shinjukuense]BBX74897.1 protein translocase subunit SecE [Mycobacterium shinjukuense]
MSDEGDEDVDAASDGADMQDNRGRGRTAVVTKTVMRPQRPTGKRSRQRAAETEDMDDQESSTAVEVAKKDVATTDVSKSSKGKAALKAKPKKPKKAGAARPANPIGFVYNYLKQVVAEMRKVIWPNRKQMLTYTSVVLAFLAFMVALVAGADLGLTKLVMWVFG